MGADLFTANANSRGSIQLTLTVAQVVVSALSKLASREVNEDRLQEHRHAERKFRGTGGLANLYLEQRTIDHT
jgi:hypothetical protein